VASPYDCNPDALLCPARENLFKRIAELELALLSIRALCAGDRLPHWREDGISVTQMRNRILDICEVGDRK